MSSTCQIVPKLGGRYHGEHGDTDCIYYSLFISETYTLQA